jgi:hypothetical protein
MTQEEKQLLLQDICARLPYGVKATTTSNAWRNVYTVNGYANYRIYLDCPVYDEGDDEWLVESVKPYLRSMESITKEELQQLQGIIDECGIATWKPQIGYDTINEIYINGEVKLGNCIPLIVMVEIVKWLLKHHFDYNGLIKKGLAIEATEGMYDVK